MATIKLTYIKLVLARSALKCSPSDRAAFSDELMTKYLIRRLNFIAKFSMINTSKPFGVSFRLSMTKGFCSDKATVISRFECSLKDAAKTMVTNEHLIKTFINFDIMWAQYFERMCIIHMQYRK